MSSGRSEALAQTTLHIVGLAGPAVLVAIWLSIALPGYFLSIDNLQSMGLQLSEVGLLALALLPTMLTGGIDLSVVATANLAAIVAGLLLNNPDLPFWLGPVAAIATGALCGLLNGMLIAYMRLPPILATLGTMQLIAGIGIILTRGHAIVGMPDWVSDVSIATVFSMIPVPTLVFVGVALSLAFILRKTRFGLELHLFGSSPRAARYAGLNAPWLIIRTYVLCAVCAALAGLIVLSRVNSASADYGGSYLLLVILINILGGVDTRGGFGAVSGVVLAVVVLQMLASGLELLSWNSFARDVLFGGLLITVMAVRAVAKGRIRAIRRPTRETAPASSIQN